MIRNRSEVATTEAKRVALDCVEAGISRSLPETVVQEAVSVDGNRLSVGGAEYDLGAYDDVVLVGGGNAAAHIASALESLLGDRIRAGMVVTDDPIPLSGIEVVKGSHPLPAEAALAGTRRILDLVEEADAETLVLAVVTGGGSALLPAPADGVSLEGLQATTGALIESGASIDEVNAVRKHLSVVKGGRLARAATPATVVGLLVSDVIGNELNVIASGPLVPDESTFRSAQNVIAEYSLQVPEGVEQRLRAGVQGHVPETPGPHEPYFDDVSIHVLADAMTTLAAAAAEASDQGYEPLLLSSRVRGEAKEAAKTHAGIAEEITATGNPVAPPAVVLSGGETTVTADGDGEGGPNQEFALAGALEVEFDEIVFCSVDTDGIDGSTDAAGALTDWTTAEPADEARHALRQHNVYPFLTQRNALVVTGPTGTNVNDLRIAVVDG